MRKAFNPATNNLEQSKRLLNNYEVDEHLQAFNS